MVENREYGCDEFVHIHVIPDENKELLDNVTSLQLHGKGISEAWKGALKEPNRYKVISPEHLLAPLKNEKDTKSLLHYLEKRYWQ
jgi:hypothetical protein